MLLVLLHHSYTASSRKMTKISTANPLTWNGYGPQGYKKGYTLCLYTNYAAFGTSEKGL